MQYFDDDEVEDFEGGDEDADTEIDFDEEERDEYDILHEEDED